MIWIHKVIHAGPVDSMSVFRLLKWVINQLIELDDAFLGAKSEGEKKCILLWNIIHSSREWWFSGQEPSLPQHCTVIEMMMAHLHHAG